MRSRFDEQLATLHKELIRMGALCEDAISSARKALLEGSPELAEKVYPIDAEIDRMERDIETLCLKLLLHQQPVARDLRQISAALKMITDMERIGDQASDIAEIITFMQGKTSRDFVLIDDMAAAAGRMVTDSIDAYVRGDVELAHRVMREDDIVDELFSKVRKSLIDMMVSSPDEGEFALDILMIAKYFERIGDHATNIAEWVEFAVTGLHVTEAEI